MLKHSRANPYKVVRCTTLRKLFCFVHAIVAKNTTISAKSSSKAYKKAKLLYSIQHLLAFPDGIKEIVVRCITCLSNSPFGLTP